MDTKDNAADFGAKMLDLEAMSTCMNKLNMKSRSVAGFRVECVISVTGVSEPVKASGREVWDRDVVVCDKGMY